MLVISVELLIFMEQKDLKRFYGEKIISSERIHSRREFIKPENCQRKFSKFLICVQQTR